MEIAGGRGLTILSLDVRLNVAGKLLTLLYRSPLVYAEVTDTAGRSFSYRVLPETASDGMLVGPFPSSLDEVKALLEGRLPSAVRSIRFVPSVRHAFSSKVVVRFEAISYNP